jgi:hypothetical protein
VSRIAAAFVFLAAGQICAAATAQKCLPESSSLTHAEAVPGGVAYCHDTGEEGVPPVCLKAAWSADAAPYSATVYRRPDVPVSGIRTVDDKAVEVCEPSGGCRLFETGLLDPYLSADRVAAVNRRLGRLAVLTGAQESSDPFPRVQLYDLKTGKLLRSRAMTFERPAKTSDYVCGDLRWLGDTLLISTNVCAGPGGQSWLARGRNLAPIGLLGSRRMNTYGARPVHVRGNQWAFLSAFSRELVVQDIVRGKVLRRINLKGVVEEGDEDGDFLVALPGDRLAIVLGGRQLGDIVLFGKGGGAPESRHTAPRCPKAPTVE